MIVDQSIRSRAVALGSESTHAGMEGRVPRAPATRSCDLCDLAFERGLQRRRINRIRRRPEATVLEIFAAPNPRPTIRGLAAFLKRARDRNATTSVALRATKPPTGQCSPSKRPRALQLVENDCRPNTKQVASAARLCYEMPGGSVAAPLFEKNIPMPGNRPHQHEAGRPRWIQKPLSASRRADFPVVAIGASAGGLKACKKLLDALPAVNGMAFILVQHLDPSHDSMMVGLLAGHTSMPVLQASDGMAIERGRVYVIPPGVYLSVDQGTLRISRPQARHGARLPFDFLLNSLAREYGARAVCVILSGTGADGSVGLMAVKA